MLLKIFMYPKAVLVIWSEKINVYLCICLTLCLWYILVYYIWILSLWYMAHFSYFKSIFRLGAKKRSWETPIVVSLPNINHTLRIHLKKKEGKNTSRWFLSMPFPRNRLKVPQGWMLWSLLLLLSTNHTFTTRALVLLIPALLFVCFFIIISFVCQSTKTWIWLKLSIF